MGARRRSACTGTIELPSMETQSLAQTTSYSGFSLHSQGETAVAPSVCGHDPRPDHRKARSKSLRAPKTRPKPPRKFSLQFSRELRYQCIPDGRRTPPRRRPLRLPHGKPLPRDWRSAFRARYPQAQSSSRSGSGCAVSPPISPSSPLTSAPAPCPRPSLGPQSTSRLGARPAVPDRGAPGARPPRPRSPIRRPPRRRSKPHACQTAWAGSPACARAWGASAAGCAIS